MGVSLHDVIRNSIQTIAAPEGERPFFFCKKKANYRERGGESADHVEIYELAMRQPGFLVNGIRILYVNDLPIDLNWGDSVKLVKRVCVTMICMATLLNSQVSFATTLAGAKQQAAALKNQISSTTLQIQQDQVRVETLKTRLGLINHSLQNVRVAMSANLAHMRVVNHQLVVLGKRIKVNERQLTTTRTELQGQLKTMYEHGTVSYLQVLFQSTSFQDFLTRLNMLVTVANAGQALEKRFQALKQTLAVQHRQTVSYYGELIHTQVSDNVLQQADVLLQQEQQQSIQSIQTNMSNQQLRHGELESQLQLTQQQIASIEAATARAEQLMHNTTYVSQTVAGMPSINLQNMLKYAEGYLGTPYSWGGTSPSGFDCSGFTQYVFAHSGVSILRTSEQQFAEGVSVSYPNLSLGDLVFFSTYAPGATHVGIYIGNGLMIDAQDYGVSIDNISNSYWGPKYLGARQLVK